MLAKDETALTSKIAACQEGCPADDVTTSRDMTALARAGPCAGYERLVLLEALASRGVEFRACVSPDDVKTKFEELVVLKKHLAVLMASCKTAVSALVGARKKAATLKEKQKLKEIKEAAADKKRGAAAVPGKLVTCFCVRSSTAVYCAWARAACCASFVLQLMPCLCQVRLPRRRSLQIPISSLILTLKFGELQTCKSLQQQHGSGYGT